MKIITTNKRAYFDYEFSKTYETGIILLWHEVKSVKTSNVNIRDSIVRLEKRELWIKNMDVSLYKKTSHNLVYNYEPKRSRKLLANKSEIWKIAWELDKPWNVLVPLDVFLNKKWLIKIKVWIWKLKKKIEKKQILKERDQKKQMQREIKNLGL